MNKMYEYGLQAAEVGKTLIEPKLIIPTATSNTRSKLMSIGTFYAPRKARPETLYFTYCAAIIDAILELYPASNNLYSQLNTQWRTPDCQAIIKQFEAELAKHHTIRPTFLVNMMSSNPDSDGWKLQENLVCDFIKRYCNRPSDLKRGKPKLRAETSPYLTLTLVFHSLGQHLRLGFDDFNVYRGEAKGIMEQRTHSRRRDKLVQSLRRAGFNLHYGDKIRKAAHLWVRARILNNSLAEFAAKEFKTDRDILKILQPFDNATGYIRHPG